MKLALIGYGKMGKAIEKIALQDGHSIVFKLNIGDPLDSLKRVSIDLAIEFTQPQSAFENIRFCIENGIPVISGTTGWLDRFEEIKTLCIQRKGTFLYASNFSIGVNLFFELNEWLAEKMKKLDFGIHIEETHHNEKKDSPSGTAITLAEGIMKHHKYTKWINNKSDDSNTLGIISHRKPNIAGTHVVNYVSSLESIEITHTSHDRSVFAQGVVLVAKWIHRKKGIFTMSDFINSN